MDFSQGVITAATWLFMMLGYTQPQVHFNDEHTTENGEHYIERKYSGNTSDESVRRR
jgi:hypothetical protein